MASYGAQAHQACKYLGQGLALSGAWPAPAAGTGLWSLARPDELAQKSRGVLPISEPKGSPAQDRSLETLVVQEPEGTFVTTSKVHGWIHRASKQAQGTCKHFVPSHTRAAAEQSASSRLLPQS